VLVFARDLGIMVVGAILFATTSIRNFKPSIFGKANTLAQILALAAVLLCPFFGPRWVVLLRRGALTATVALTVFSGFHYAWRVVRQISSPLLVGRENPRRPRSRKHYSVGLDF
jgi:cardiolipin synthase